MNPDAVQSWSRLVMRGGAGRCEPRCERQGVMRIGGFKGWVRALARTVRAGEVWFSPSQISNHAIVWHCACRGQRRSPRTRASP